MSSWKWQKARIILCRVPELRGAEIWVEMGRPEILDTHEIETFKPAKAASYRTNIDADDKKFRDQRMTVQRSQVELLCRGENDFAEEVERVTYADFLKERQQAINLEREPKLDG